MARASVERAERARATQSYLTLRMRPVQCPVDVCVTCKPQPDDLYQPTKSEDGSMVDVDSAPISGCRSYYSRQEEECSGLQRCRRGEDLQGVGGD